MTTRAQLAILALLAILLLVFALFPRQAGADVPVSASAVPASDFRTLTPTTLRPAPSVTTPELRAPSPFGGSVAPSARPVPKAAPVPTGGPKAVPAASTAGISGVASWFASPHGVSAAGPALRTALGPGWRGTRVRVTGPAGSAVTILGDWMRADRLIDLDDDVFPAVCGPLSRGICEAKVTW